jgi:phosphomevalonate kinase
MTAVSAPGKVLLAGGYLVLDRAYTGLVFGLSARIHVVVRDGDTNSSPEIVVQSPQFREASWAYAYLPAPAEGGVDVTQLPGYDPSFLRLTLRGFFSRSRIPPLFI